MAEQTELEFGDFGQDAAVSGVKRSGGPGESTYEFEHSGSIGDDKVKLLTDDGESNEASTRPSWWSFQFYQQYFDVDTNQVLERVLNGMLPRGRNFILTHVRPIPDLYGPFWISVTLIFTMAICGNLAAYLSLASGASDVHWEYDFGMVTGSASAVFAYVLLVPAALCAWTWHRKLPDGYSYLETLSAYGYSLAVFIPVSIMWMVNVEWFRWILILAAVLASGAVLFSTFWPLLSADSSKLFGVLAMIGILSLHCLLAVGCKELFFHSGAVPAAVAPLDMTTLASLPDSRSGAAVDENPTTKEASESPKFDSERHQEKEKPKNKRKSPAEVQLSKTETKPSETVSTSNTVTGA